MAFSRYSRDGLLAADSQFTTAIGVVLLRQLIKQGKLPIVRETVLTAGERLDTLSGMIYGDAKYWWVIAAASDIGWGMQAPPGTVVRTVDLLEVERLIG